jgi:hypothetical protein
MGGANALTTSLRPDLRSATVQSTNAVDDTTTVRVCFSKAIASLPQTARFHMGDYSGSTFGTGPITAVSADAQREQLRRRRVPQLRREVVHVRHGRRL